MSFIPKFLDNQSITFLFLYSDKLAEIEKYQKKVEKITDEIKKKEKKSKKLANLCKMILKNTNKEKSINHSNEYNQKRYESKKNEEKEKNDDAKNNGEVKLKKKLKKLNSINVINNGIFTNKIKEINLSPHRTKTMKKIKRLLSQPEIFSINEVPISENIFEKNKTSSDFNFDETFKTSLYRADSLKKNESRKSESSSEISSSSSNKKKKKLKNIIFSPEYAERLSFHLSPRKIIRVKDYENFQNFKIEDSIDKELINLFKTHKEMIKKVKIMKAEADKLVRKELDRIGKCFYLEDYGGKYNTNIKTVIGALIGEDNIRNELLRQEKEQKDYFRTIKSIRNFNGLYFRKYM